VSQKQSLPAYTNHITTMTISNSQDAPLIVVGGATGNQGGSVIRFLIESPKAYRIRGLTRDATKPNAKKLADQGVEVVSVNLTPENKAKIVEAYSGADVIFVRSRKQRARPFTDRFSVGHKLLGAYGCPKG
jgi:uncharacterized protein YbjT (DUF2867 family)